MKKPEMLIYVLCLLQLVQYVFLFLESAVAVEHTAPSNDDSLLTHYICLQFSVIILC